MHKHCKVRFDCVILTQILGILLIFIPWCSFSFAQTPADLEAVERKAGVKLLLETMTANPSEPSTAARIATTPDGYLRFVGSAPSTHFTVAAAAGEKPEAVAESFLEKWSYLFISPDAAIGFSTIQVKSNGQRSYIRLRQTYAGHPVFGAQMLVQVNAAGGVDCVLSDMMRNMQGLDAAADSVDRVSSRPSLGPSAALDAARDFLSKQYPLLEFQATPGTLMIYDPSVVGNSGPVRLVWQTELSNIGAITVKENVLVDAHTGEIVWHYSLIHDVKNRMIYDANNVPGVDPGTLVRAEGGPVTGIVDVDLAYDYFGDTYDFYFTNHGRDSIDNTGYTLSATTRYVPFGQTPPYQNAFWDGSRMYFGDGFAAADDVVGHELTHGVTQYESNLIYANESGAINESFSDIWGEWIDLVNSAGDDSPGVSWLMGEDLPIGAIRSMSNPPAYGDPDRKGSPLWYTGPLDNGGVHTNSGVGNKLCYLLTDGDTFNGYTISGLGIVTVADLFYECQTNLLVAGSDYADLYFALVQAAINLGWSQADRDNVIDACRAVEIRPLSEGVSNFFASASEASPNVALSWINPTQGGLVSIDVRRSTDTFPAAPTSGTLVYQELGTSSVDGPFTTGTEVFYSAWAFYGGSDYSVVAHTRAIAGVDSTVATMPFTEDFEGGSSLLPYWLISGTNEYRTQVTAEYVPQEGINHLTMDDSIDAANYSRNELTLTIDLAIWEDVELTFWAKEFSDEAHGPPPSPFINGADFDGVAISADGVTWYEVQSLRGLSSSYQQLTVDLDAAINTHGLSYNSNFRIRFNQYDNYAISTDGIAVDNIQINGTLSDDLIVDPAIGFSSTGFEGGPFSPNATTYTLSNIGTAALDWATSPTQSWLSITPGSGTLSPSGSTIVTVALTAIADTLSTGSYADTLTFTNLESGVSRTFTAELTVNTIPPPPAAPFNPYPHDGSTTAPVDVVLSWNNPGLLATVHNDEAGQGSGTASNIVVSYTNQTIRNGVEIEPSSWTMDLPQIPLLRRSELVWTESTTLIDFDDSSAPCFFSGTIRLTDAYIDSGVEFEGPGGNDGGAVLDECGNFGVAGHSSPNFLAFNSAAALSDGGRPQDPETIHFNPPAAFVEILAGSSGAGAGQSVVMEAYNNIGSLLDSASIILASTLQPVSVSGSGISRVVISSSAGVFVLDDLIFDNDDGSQTVYDVYLDNATSPPTTLIASGLTQPMFDPGLLDYSTSYTWQVVARNAVYSTTGPIWSFTTISPPGEIEVVDSIAPIDDLDLPFGTVFIGSSRTESVTITNISPLNDLQITTVTIGAQYIEDFNDGLAQDWEEITDPQWEVVANEYRAQAGVTALRMQSTYAGQTWDDHSLQATLRRTGDLGSAAGLLLRSSEDFNWITQTGSAYLISISGNGYYYIGKYVNGVFTFIQSWTASPLLNTGTASNIVLASIEGSIIRVYFNGNLAWSGSDASVSAAGRIGLLSYSGSGSETVHYYDDVIVDDPLSTFGPISSRQQWYNEHAGAGNSPELVPDDFSPPVYPGVPEEDVDGPITILAVSDFRLENFSAPVPATIPPGGTLTFDVVYEPTEAVTQNATLNIFSNDLDEEEVNLTLSGTGVDPLSITHSPLGDTTDLGPYIIEADVISAAGLLRSELYWRTDAPTSWTTVTMANTSGTLYTAQIPGQVIGTTVDYYIEVEDTSGTLERHPLAAPTEYHSFLVMGIPNLIVTPTNLTFTQPPNTITTQTLLLENTGNWPVDWSLSEKRWLGTSPTLMVRDAGRRFEPAQSREKSEIAWNMAHQANTLLVGFRAEASTLMRSAVHSALGAQRVHSYSLIPVDVVEISEQASLQSLAAAYLAQPGVAYVEPNYIVHADLTPDDPSYALQWALNNTGQTGGTVDADIDAPEAWDLQTGSNNVIVAVIDTGYDYSHPDLVGNLWTNTAEFNGTVGVDDDGNGIVDDIHGARWTSGSGAPTNGNPQDGHGHGTHVSGTIGAVTDNGLGVAGVSWLVRLMGLKFLDDDGSGYTADAISAIEYAVDQGAHLSNNSWGGGGFSQALKDAIDAAGAAEQLFIAAAGNSGTNNDSSPHYPSSYVSPTIIAVANSTNTDVRSGTSSYGLTSVDLAAPGSSILSTWTGGGYNTISGTSMATPHVSGVVALLLSSAPGSAALDLKQWIMDGVDILPAWSGLTVTGGRLNAYNSLRLAGIPWLDQDLQSGTLDAGSSATVQVSANTQGLADGTTDSALIEFSGDPDGPTSVTVFLNVVEIIQIVHSPLNDTNDAIGPYPVAAEITAAAGLDLSELWVYYSTNGGASFTATALTSAGGDTYIGNIPGQALGTTVEYYISAQDTLARIRTNPASAPAERYSFSVGYPVLEVAVNTSLDRTLNPDEIQNLPAALTLRNIGYGQLNWSLSENPSGSSFLRPAPVQNMLPGVHAGIEPPEAKDDRAVYQSAAIIPDNQGGPDGGGYRYIDSNEPGGPSFDWIEVSATGTNLNLTDDSYFYPINLPFAFNFYDADYTQVAVGSNGGIYFVNQYLTLGNGPIPGPYTISRFIALYWDDLAPSGANNVYYQIVGSAPNRILVVQWENVAHYASSARVTAQAQLFERAGRILLLYDDPSSEAGSGGTVGIQGDSATGLQYLYNQAILQNQLAILFNRGIPWIDETPPLTGTLNTGESAMVTVTFDATGLLEGFTADGYLDLASDTGGLNDALINVPVSITVGPQTPMVNAIVCQAGSSTNANVVDYEVTFNRPVSGVGPSNFSLNPTVTGANIAGVTPNAPAPAAVWTATVNTGSGEGLLGLDLTNPAGIQDGSAQPLDTANLPFNGEDCLIDKTPPDTWATGPTGAWQVGNPVILLTFSATDTGSGIGVVRLFYRKNGAGGFQQYGGDFTSSPIAVNVSTIGYNGIYEFYTIGIDVAGNLENAPGAADIVLNLVESIPVDAKSNVENWQVYK